MSLSVEINQFHLEDEGEAPGGLIVLSESEVDIDRLSTANTPGLVVAQIDSDFEEEEMALNQRRSLRDLMASRNKGQLHKKYPSPKFLQLFLPLPFLSLPILACTR